MVSAADIYYLVSSPNSNQSANNPFDFTKQRGITGQIKQYSMEQTSEADGFDLLCLERVSAIITQSYCLSTMS